VRCEGVCIKLLTFTIDYDREQFRNRRGLAPRLLSISSCYVLAASQRFADLLLTGGKCALPPDVGVGFFRWRPTRVSNFAQLPLGPARNNESAGDGAAPPLSQLGGVRFSKGPKTDTRVLSWQRRRGRGVNVVCGRHKPQSPEIGVAHRSHTKSVGLPCIKSQWIDRRQAQATSG